VLLWSLQKTLSVMQVKKIMLDIGGATGHRTLLMNTNLSEDFPYFPCRSILLASILNGPS